MSKKDQVFLVRAGKHGERESAALEAGVATIGFDGVPDLRKFKDRYAVGRFGGSATIFRWGLR